MLQTLLFILTVVQMTDCFDADDLTDIYSTNAEDSFTGEAGLCIRVFCFFTVPQNVSDPIRRNWFKGDPQNASVEVLCFDMSNYYLSNWRECSFLLKYLVQGESDSEYRLKLEWEEGNVYIFPRTVNIAVKDAPIILNSSRCFVWGDELSCMCVSSGVPLPHIHWIVDGVAEYYSAFSEENTVSIITISIAGLGNLNATICVSKNLIGLALMEIQVHSQAEKPKVSWSFSTPWIFFTLSIVLNVIFASSLIVVLWRRERNKKTKNDDHVHMTATKREQSVYETIKMSSERF